MQYHPQQLLNYIKEQKDSFINLTEELVQIETPSNRPRQQSKLLDLVESHLTKLNFYTDRLPGSQFGGQLYARPYNRPHGAPYQLIIGHSDTIWPVDTLQKMPFSNEGHYLKGPGIYDMKTGLAMLLMALKTIDHFGFEPSLCPTILIYSDEETGAPESTPVIERLARYAKRAFILEPALAEEGKIITSSKGFGSYQIQVRGETSNTGNTPLQSNGMMLELSQVVQRLYDLNDPERDLHVEVGEIDGGIRSNIVASDNKATVNIRIGRTQDIKRIEQAIFDIRSTTSDVDLSIKGDIYRLPMQQNERNTELWKQADHMADKLNLNIEQGSSEVASVANTISPYTATLDGLGPVGKGAHSYLESINLEKTLERCALLALLIQAPEGNY